MTLETYLFFNGRCDEALAFYKTAVGAEVEMLMRFNQSPDPLPAGAIPPGFENKVMHCSFRVGNTRVMASDGCEAGGPKFAGFTLCLAVKTEADADKYFNALAEGGTVKMPLSKTFWSPRYGMLVDKFGVEWMVNVEQAM